MERLNGASYKGMIDYGARNLVKNCDTINQLNVFPVPDGDTGTNMSMTLANSARELEKLSGVTAGKIAAVGTQIEAPAGAQVIDAQGRLVTPGCVDAHCHIGLDNEAMGWEGKDYNEMADPVTPHMRAIDSIYPQDEAFGTAIQGGVTTACTGPGSANVVGGTFAAIKLVGNRVDNMIVKHPAAMKCAFGENPKRVYGQGSTFTVKFKR